MEIVVMIVYDFISMNAKQPHVMQKQSAYISYPLLSMRIV